MATSSFHRDATTGDRHPVHDYDYADATERTGATGFVEDDVGRVARQASDNSFWVLVDHDPPTWTSITAGGGAGGYETIQSSGAPRIQRSIVNFASGLEAADDGPNSRTNVTPTYGSSASTICQGNDARLSDARTPTGSAGGQLGGSYPNPDVRGLRETAGPTELSMGAVADGEYLRRVGSAIVGASAGGGGDPQVSVFQQQESSGTGGGSNSTGPNFRSINTTVYNGISGASRSGNTVTLPAGTYLVLASGVANGGGEHKIYLYDVTADANIAHGTSAYAVAAVNESRMTSAFTISVTSELRLGHFITSGSGSSEAFGRPVWSGLPEVYAELTFVKVA